MKKENLITIICALGFLVMAFLLVWPAFEDTVSQKKDLTVIIGQAEELKTYIEKVKNLEEQYNLNPEDYAEILAILPKEQEISELLKQLESLAMVNKLKMSSIDFKEAVQKARPETKSSNIVNLSPKLDANSAGVQSPTSQPQEAYKTMQVSLRLEGFYADFKNYLKAIEGNGRLMDVTFLNLLIVQTDSPSSFSVSLYVYYQ